VTFEEVMKLTGTIGHPSALQDEEARVLYDLCCQVPEHGTVVEIGCDIGRTSSVIAQVGLERGYCSVHVDPWSADMHRVNFIPWMVMMDRIGGKFEVHRMPSYEANLPRSCLLLIDGNHDEDGVMKDCRIARSSVIPSGILAVHDYGQECTPSVKEVVDKMIRDTEWEKISVTKTLGVWRRR